MDFGQTQLFGPWVISRGREVTTIFNTVASRPAGARRRRVGPSPLPKPPTSGDFLERQKWEQQMFERLRDATEDKTRR